MSLETSKLTRMVDVLVFLVRPASKIILHCNTALNIGITMLHDERCLSKSTFGHCSRSRFVFWKFVRVEGAQERVGLAHGSG